MKKIITNMSGVTLFAVTITIIVLLILTGVTSSIILSQNEILDNAMTARKESTIVEEMEQVDIAYSATTIRQTSRTTITDADALKLQEELLKISDGITVTVDIDEDGNKGFLVEFQKTGHYYFIENNEVRIATEGIFSNDITPVYAILYSDGDLRFNTTGKIDETKTAAGITVITQTENISQINYTTSPLGTYPSSVTSVTFEEKIIPQYTSHWFHYCTNLKKINNIEKLHTQHVTDMGYMFYLCNNLEALDLSSFNTSNVTSMDVMFAHCQSLTELDLSNFDTTNVQSMSQMFYGCINLNKLNLATWNTSKVKTVDSMFEECINLITLDLRSFDIINIENYTSMFNLLNSSAKIIVKNEDIKKWITEKFGENTFGSDNKNIITVSELITE